MATRISIIIPLLVITLCCVGIVEGGYMALEYLVLGSKVRPKAMQPEAAAAPAISRGILKKNGYQVILTRNLFAAVPASDANRLTAFDDNLDSLQETSLGIVLMGTIGDNEGGNRAIIVDKKTLKQQIYRQGEGVQGAIIKDIRRGKVILTSGGRDEILDMNEAAKLRPAQKIDDGSQVLSLQQDKAPAALEKSTSEVPLAEELHQTLLPGESAGPEKTAKKIVLPIIIRPLRPPVSN